MKGRRKMRVGDERKWKRKGEHEIGKKKVEVKGEDEKKYESKLKKKQVESGKGKERERT